MPNHHSFPTLFDDVLKINISKIKKSGFLEANKSGNITWSRNGESFSSISIDSRITNSNTILLSYSYNGESRVCKIQIVTVQSNLGKGEIPLFICPVTHKKSRILYFINGYFVHREASKESMYESQTYSKNMREQFKLFENITGHEKAYEKIHSKYFKKFYNGKPTKSFVKLLKKIQLSESYSQRDFERLIMI